MRIADFKTWLSRGTYPRLFVPILLIILAVTLVRYHLLMQSERQEAQQRLALSLQHLEHYLLPQLAVAGDFPDQVQRLLDHEAAFNPWIERLQWQTDGFLVLVKHPVRASAVPAWFSAWVDMEPFSQTLVVSMGAAREGQLVLDGNAGPELVKIWATVGKQLQITALNIVMILGLLTLLLRANARMLNRLSKATERFRAGELGTRMAEAGTLESRAVAKTFNGMAAQVQGLVTSLQSNQRQQEEQLHFTRQLVDAFPLPVFLRSNEGECLGVNKAWEQLFDTTASDVLGDPMSSDFVALPTERPAGERRVYPRNDNEILVRAAHAQLREMAYFKAPFTDMDGKVAGTIGTLVDITERKLAQEALLAEKERAEVTLSSIGDGVITTDPVGAIETINEVAQFLTGFSQAQAHGRPLAEVFKLQGTATEPGVLMQAPEVDSAVQAQQQVLLHRSGERYAIEFTAAPIRKPNGTVVGTVLVFRDLTQTRELMHQISWQTRHDPLTGLDNRVALAERLTHGLFMARQDNYPLAVCLLDLDHFQHINDRHGSWTGDRLLKEVATRLSAAAAPPDAVARLGGDEFALLIGGLPDLAAIRARVQQVLNQLAQPYAIDDSVIMITASAGVAIFPSDDANPDTLLRHADQAMWQAKHTGRNCLHVFDAGRDQEVQTLFTRQARLGQAITAGELRLYYQPKVHLRTGQVFGMEALLRWQHPEQGLLGPGHFLPWIEDNDLSVDVGEWVMREALAQMRRWSAQGHHWAVSVNIAARHFHRSDFVSRLRGILQEFPMVLPSQLELEILESAALEDMQHMRQVMQEAQLLGVRFALDDFGTGYSSLSYLKRLPAETIKIDQSFVQGVLDDQEDITLVSAIVALAHAFERDVLAEGVETIAQGQRLLALGCELAQGFGIARPMPAQEVAAFALGYTNIFCEPSGDALSQSAKSV
jgi:diguanylate cyclase (GGDEF)-like protein/PAS domain S-box-containing protein